MKGKTFFFAKKNQKTFVRCGSAAGAAAFLCFVQLLARGVRKEAGAVLARPVDRLHDIRRQGHVDPHHAALGRRHVHQKRHGFRIAGIAHDGVERARGRQGFAILAHALAVQCQSLGGHAARLVERAASADASRKIRKLDAIIAALGLAHQRDIARHPSPQPDAGLLLDASQGADREIPFRVRDGDPSRPRRVLELPVIAPGLIAPGLIALGCDMNPPGRFERTDHVSAIHAHIYTHQRANSTPPHDRARRTRLAAAVAGR